MSTSENVAGTPAATTAKQGPNLWWVFLITGPLWLILSLFILRFNDASIDTIAVLFGVVAIAAGVNEFFTGAMVKSWRWLHFVLGALFIVAGVVALFNPTGTFWALASIIGWFLLFKGTSDIVLAVMTRRENETWWLGLIAGIVEIGLAFWAAGGFGRRVLLLVVWVAAACMIRGITEIVMAFRLRRLGSAATAQAEMPAGYVKSDYDEWPVNKPDMVNVPADARAAGADLKTKIPNGATQHAPSGGPPMSGQSGAMTPPAPPKTPGTGS